MKSKFLMLAIAAMMMSGVDAIVTDGNLRDATPFSVADSLGELLNGGERFDYENDRFHATNVPGVEASEDGTTLRLDCRVFRGGLDDVDGIRNVRSIVASFVDYESCRNFIDGVSSSQLITRDSDVMVYMPRIVADVPNFRYVAIPVDYIYAEINERDFYQEIQDAARRQ